VQHSKVTRVTMPLSTSRPKRADAMSGVSRFVARPAPPPKEARKLAEGSKGKRLPSEAADAEAPLAKKQRAPVAEVQEAVSTAVADVAKQLVARLRALPDAALKQTLLAHLTAGDAGVIKALSRIYPASSKPPLVAAAAAAPKPAAAEKPMPAPKPPALKPAAAVSKPAPPPPAPAKAKAAPAKPTGPKPTGKKQEQKAPARKPAAPAVPISQSRPRREEKKPAAYVAGAAPAPTKAKQMALAAAKKK
jgi:hypothetical protein